MMASKFQDWNTEIDPESLPWTVPLSDKYDYLYPSADRRSFAAEKGRVEYTLDKQGNVLSSKKMAKDYSGDLGEGMTMFSAEEGFCHGVKDASGKVIAEAKYNNIENFHQGFTTVEIRGNHQIIDKTGKIIYKSPTSASITRIEGTRYLILEYYAKIFDAKTGETKVLGQKIAELRPGGGGQYIARIDKTHFMLLDENFEPKDGGQLYSFIGAMSDGLYYAEKLKGIFYSETASHYKIKTEVEKGYYDKNGKLIVALPDDTAFGGRFSENRAFVFTPDKLKIIDRDGKTIASFDSYLDENSTALDLAYMETDAVFINGYAPVEYGRGYVVCDKDGNLVVKPFADMISRGPDNSFSVHYRQKVGILDLGEGL